MIDVIKPDEKTIRKELAKARERLERWPDVWTSLEPVGRCLRWLGDEEAATHFHRAIANYKVRESDPESYMRLGNLYRLCDDASGAQRCFEQAHALYAARVSRDNADPLDIAPMIPASFLVGNDDEVASLTSRLRAIYPDTGLIVYPIAKLAAARHNRDSRLVEEAVGEVAAMIRRERAKVWDCGGVSLWDWYEIALAIWQEIKK